MHRRTALLVAAVLILSQIPHTAAEQPRALKPTVFAVTGAKVVVAPGQVLAKATVVIRDGLIEAVGPDIKPPPDALLIDGTGLTVYPGGIVTGQSALVSLSDAPPREAVLRSPVALHGGLRPAPGAEYPRVLMGTVAHARQTFLDAVHHQRIKAAFEKNGHVGKRPPLDPTLDALGVALDRKQPVVFDADTADQIDRALSFAEEFHLDPII